MAGTPAPSSTPPISAFVRWLILVLASIGFAFDIYEILMLPLIVRPAVQELGLMGLSIRTWIVLLLFIPAVFGGIFGLMGGYLTDRLGRRRVLTWSILLYAVSAFLAGFSTSLPMLLILRTTTFVGVCVEFVAAVAWLAELFPDPEKREKALGYTQAFSSLGGLLVAFAAGFCSQYGDYFPPIMMPDFLQGIFGAIEGTHAGWRYTLMSGLIPAIPLLLIRPFLPESPVWAEKKRTGTLKRPSFIQLFNTPRMRRTTIVTMIMFACSYGAAFGALQHIPRIVPGLSNVKNNAPAEPAARRDYETQQGAEYTKLQEFGGLLGRFLLVLVIIRVVSRRAVLRVFQVPGMIVIPLVFYFFLTMPDEPWFHIPLDFVFLGKLPISPVSIGCLLCGLFTVAQFSFWGNYLPTVYPVHLRGTGESFAANIGGRLIGTSFWAATVFLSAVMPGNSPPQKLAYAAAAVGLFVYSVGFVMSFFLPEPEADMTDDDRASAPGRV